MVLSDGYLSDTEIIGEWFVCVTGTLAAETDGCLSDKDGR